MLSIFGWMEVIRGPHNSLKFGSEPQGHARRLSLGIVPPELIPSMQKSNREQAISQLNGKDHTSFADHALRIAASYFALPQEERDNHPDRAKIETHVAYLNEEFGLFGAHEVINAYRTVQAQIEANSAKVEKTS